MAKRKDEFVYGTPNEGCSVYGYHNESVRPMTAEHSLGWYKGLFENPRLYRLVEVPPAEVEAQAKRERRARKGKR